MKSPDWCLREIDLGVVDGAAQVAELGTSPSRDEGVPRWAVAVRMGSRNN